MRGSLSTTALAPMVLATNNAGKAAAFAPPLPQIYIKHRFIWKLPTHGQAGMQMLLEGRLLNLDMTSPASTIALTLMFLRTNDAGVAAAFAPPSTKFALDSARPDFIMLRTLARNLVLWDALQPTAEWMAAQLPDIIKAGSPPKT